MFRSIITIGAILLFALLAFNVQAACTYNEAVMAFNNGNQFRGQTLMKMAAKDGDQRAMQFLASNGGPVDSGIVAKKLLRVADSSSDSLTGSLATVHSTAEIIN